MRSVLSHLVVMVALLALGCHQRQPETHLEKVEALDLDLLIENDLVIYYSTGREGRARVFASLIGDVVGFYANGYGWKITPKVAVLTVPDWQATLENPYGVPAMRQPGPIAFIPADVEAGVVYHDTLALADRMSPELNTQIVAACGTLAKCAADGADAIIVHEIAHMYQAPAGIGSPAYWFNEFVADYLQYAYFRERHPPQATPFLLQLRLAGTEVPQFETLDALELNIEEALPKEWARMHWVLFERAEQVYNQQGLGFVARLAIAFPREQYPFGCTSPEPTTVSTAPLARSWTGLCEASRVPTAELLQRLDEIEPGFVEWASKYAQIRR